MTPAPLLSTSNTALPWPGSMPASAFVIASRRPLLLNWAIGSGFAGDGTTSAITPPSRENGAGGDAGPSRSPGACQSLPERMVDSDARRTGHRRHEGQERD